MRNPLDTPLPADAPSRRRLFALAAVLLVAFALLLTTLGRQGKKSVAEHSTTSTTQALAPSTSTTVTALPAQPAQAAATGLPSRPQAKVGSESSAQAAATAFVDGLISYLRAGFGRVRLPYVLRQFASQLYPYLSGHRERYPGMAVQQLQVVLPCDVNAAATVLYTQGPGGDSELHIYLSRTAIGWRVYEIGEFPLQLPKLPRSFHVGPEACGV